MRLRRVRFSSVMFDTVLHMRPELPLPPDVAMAILGAGAVVFVVATYVCYLEYRRVTVQG